MYQRPASRLFLWHLCVLEANTHLLPPFRSMESHNAPRSSLGKMTTTLTGTRMCEVWSPYSADWTIAVLLHYHSYLCFWHRRDGQAGTEQSWELGQTPRGQRSAEGQPDQTTRSLNAPPAADPRSRNSVEEDHWFSMYRNSTAALSFHSFYIKTYFALSTNLFCSSTNKTNGRKTSYSLYLVLHLTCWGCYYVHVAPQIPKLVDTCRQGWLKYWAVDTRQQWSDSLWWKNN